MSVLVGCPVWELTGDGGVPGGISQDPGRWHEASSRPREAGDSGTV